MKVTVNKCPHTGRLFEDDRAYNRHMREWRKVIKQDAERAEFAPHFDEFIKDLYQANSVDELAEWLTENYWIIARHFGYRCWSWNRDYPPMPQPEDKFKFSFAIYKFEELDTSWHATPLKETPRNICDYRYMQEWGWRGSIRIEFEGSAHSFFDSDHLKKVGIFTGSGSGANPCARYDVRMFAKDFRRMAGPEVYAKLAKRTDD